MSESANRDIVTRFYTEGVNDRNWDVVEETLAPDFTHSGHVLGIGGQRRGLETLYAAFPDVRVQIDDTISAEETVVTRMTWSGTNAGSFMDVPASGRRVTWTAISIIRLAEGKIAQAWANEDDLGILTQIGATAAVPDR